MSRSFWRHVRGRVSRRFRRLGIECLEGRQLLTTSAIVALDVGNNLVITGNASGSSLAVSFNATTGNYTISDAHSIQTAIAAASGSGSDTVTIPASAIAGSEVIVNLSAPAGDSDLLTLNLSATPFPLSVVVNGGAGSEKLAVDLPAGAALPGAGIAYTGRATATLNALEISGAGQNLTYTPDGATVGKGTLSDGQGTLSFTNLAPLDMHGLGTAAFTAAAGDAPVELVNGVDFTGGGTHAAIRVEPNGTGTQFESVAFWDNTTLVVNTSANFDRGAVTVNSASNAHGNTNLSINTLGLFATISLAGPIVVSGNVSLDAAVGSIVQTGGGITAALLNTTAWVEIILNAANFTSQFTALSYGGGGDIQFNNSAAPLKISSIYDPAGAVQVVNSGGIEITGHILATGVASLDDTSAGIEESGAGAIGGLLVVQPSTVENGPTVTGRLLPPEVFLSNSSLPSDVMLPLLVTQSVAGTTLNGANVVGSWLANNQARGNVEINNTATPLVISAVTQYGGNVQIVNSGGILIAGSIDVNSFAGAAGIVSLDDLTANIQESGAGMIFGYMLVTANPGPPETITPAFAALILDVLLITQSVTGTVLDGPNTIATCLASNSANGDVQLNNSGSLSIAGISNPVGNVNVINSGGIDITGTIAASDSNGVVSLDDTSAYIQESGGAIVGEATLHIIPAPAEEAPYNASSSPKTTSTSVDNATILVSEFPVPELITKSVTGTILNGANEAQSLLATNTTSGDVQFNDSAFPLTIRGISETGGNVQVITSSGIDIIGTIADATPDKTVSLESLGSLLGYIVESSGGRIDGAEMTAGTALHDAAGPTAPNSLFLVTQSGTDTTLNGPNAVAAFYATNTTSGNIQINNTSTSDLVLTQVSNPGGSVQIISPNVVLRPGALISGGQSVSIDASQQFSFQGTIASPSQAVITSETCAIDLDHSFITAAGLLLNGIDANSNLDVYHSESGQASAAATVDNYYTVRENTNSLASAGTVEAQEGDQAVAIYAFANLGKLSIAGNAANDFVSYYVGTGNSLPRFDFDGGGGWNGMAAYGDSNDNLIGIGDSNNPSLASVGVTTYLAANNFQPAAVNAPLRLSVNAADLAILQMFGGSGNDILVNATPVASALLDGGSGEDTLVGDVGGLGSPALSPGGVDILLGGDGADALYGRGAINYLGGDYDWTSAPSGGQATLVSSPPTSGFNHLLGAAGYNYYLGAAGDYADGTGGTVVGTGITESSTLAASNSSTLTDPTSTLASIDQAPAVKFVANSPF